MAANQLSDLIISYFKDGFVSVRAIANQISYRMGLIDDLLKIMNSPRPIANRVNNIALPSIAKCLDAVNAKNTQLIKLLNQEAAVWERIKLVVSESANQDSIKGFQSLLSKILRAEMNFIQPLLQENPEKIETFLLKELPVLTSEKVLKTVRSI